MAVGDWSEASLATYTDVIGRYSRAYDLTGETLLANQQAAVTAYIAKAKEYIGRRLLTDLRKLWVEMDLDTDAEIRDYLANPEVFKEAAVAWTLKLLFEDNSFEEGDYHDKRMRDFMAEFRVEFDLAMTLVEFDRDTSGDIDEAEKAGSGVSEYRFMRV